MLLHYQDSQLRLLQANRWTYSVPFQRPVTCRIQYKKDLNDPDNHNGVITHLEPDILECKVKWALRSTTMNKANGSDGIPLELFQILKDDAVKVQHSICQQTWKTAVATGLEKVSFHFNSKEG